MSAPAVLAHRRPPLATDDTEPLGPLEPGELRRVFARFASGVAAVCALHDDQPVGMVVSSFTSVSLDPALVAVNVQRSSTTWPVLRERRRVGVSVLGEHHEPVSRALAGTRTGRFANAEWHSSPDGAVFLGDGIAWFECELWREVDAGDHVIVLLEVKRLGTSGECSPLVFWGSGYRRLSPIG